ncbi:YSC84-related protein [Novosphingobium sp. BL-8A]|uniref:lipid-binding SYLF domain-containing protein n=1 Tax=Novosphingobium sp. BL-8A TaxID=3127639 RepID=UPI0037584B3E
MPSQVMAASSAAEIEAKSRAALHQLYAANPKAAAIGKRAKGIMVFPKIIKGGFVIAGSSGDGVLLVNDKVTKFFNISSASVGLQAGAQGYGYALFFMNNEKLAEATSNESWDVGSDPNVVMIDKGAAAELDTTTLNKAVYAFAFGQKGLMAGISLKGSRTKQIHPK